MPKGPRMLQTFWTRNVPLMHNYSLDGAEASQPIHDFHALTPTTRIAPQEMEQSIQHRIGQRVRAFDPETSASASICVGGACRWVDAC